MLLKKEADLLVSKLQAILLLEADYNVMNKISFNTHLILLLEEYNMIPREIIGGWRGMAAIQIAINKKLQVYIVNQNKLLSIIISTDALNYFDRVAHPTVGMICQYFGLPINFVTTFFNTIQNIQMYLMIAYGLSNNFYSG